MRSRSACLCVQGVFFDGDVWVAPALHSSPPFHQVQYPNQRWQQRSDELTAALEIAGELSPGKKTH